MLLLRQKVVEEVAGLFGVLSHPTRLGVLRLLHGAEHDVTDLRNRLGVPAANVSQHLALLRSNHLVILRRDGTRAYCSIRDPRVSELINRALDILDDDVASARALRRAIRRVRFPS